MNIEDYFGAKPINVTFVTQVMANKSEPINGSRPEVRVTGATHIELRISFKNSIEIRNRIQAANLALESGSSAVQLSIPTYGQNLKVTDAEATVGSPVKKGAKILPLVISGELEPMDTLRIVGDETTYTVVKAGAVSQFGTQTVEVVPRIKTNLASLTKVLVKDVKYTWVKSSTKDSVSTKTMAAEQSYSYRLY